MSFKTALTERLRLTDPIIQAPMAGGATTAGLAAAVCEAGALGFIGAVYLTPDQIAEASREVRARTSKPFGMNLFAPLAAPDVPMDAARALERLAPLHAELDLPAPTLPIPKGGSFGEQLGAVLDSGAAVFSFTFGIPPPSAIEAFKARGIFLMGTATTVEEVEELKTVGVGAVVVHRKLRFRCSSPLISSFATAKNIVQHTAPC